MLGGFDFRTWLPLKVALGPSSAWTDEAAHQSVAYFQY